MIYSHDHLNFVQQYLRNIVEGTIPSDNMKALMQGRARGVQRLKDGAMGRAIFQYSDEEVINNNYYN